MIDISGYELAVLHEGDFTVYRGCANGLDPILLVVPSGEHPPPKSFKRLEREYALRAELDPSWAALPLAIATHNHRPALVLGDPGGLPLNRLLGRALELSTFLRIAISFAAACRRMHESGLIHKDIKPANVLVDIAGDRVRLTGFGIASRLPHERQQPAPPEIIVGTFAYMAPEQTGRMNRSIDARSDLYALGITLYEMLTGMLPFAASDPMEWIHCHVARLPLPPSQLVSEIPGPVDAIILKLLAKSAEDRYQTAAGVEADLQLCLAGWKAHRRIDPFPLGAHDASDQLLIPERLYGRKVEIDTLVTAFDRVVTQGTAELVLVSGYAGIGKSSIVNELQKVLVPPRALFAAGKFDQYKRDIPYATLAQVFQKLLCEILGMSEAQVSHWRDALREALGANGQLIVNLVPELELVIGKQPPVADLPPRDAQKRFQTIFRRFLGVFANKEHPLALFVDDLQWLDAATLDLLEDLLTRRDVQHLIVIGAYRDNEVNSAHPLMRKLGAIREAGAIVQEVTLAPLAREDLGQLVADSLHCDLERVAPLARLVHEKTGGNPFFAIQFVSALAEEGLLTFDHTEARWLWDLNRIHAKGYTDNVVDLMVGKLNRLPVETLKALQELACLGNIAEITTLSTICGNSEEEVHSDLWEAVRLELILRLEGSYKFVHDRVQEAAYSLIPEELRAEAHLRIGRLLTEHTPPERQEDAIFEIVTQFNRGAALIASRDEREELAELNLIAGKRAKASTAYASAVKYFIAGVSLLGDDRWARRHELTFSLELYRAECEFLTGELAAAEKRLTMLSCRAANAVELATVTCLRMDVYTTLDVSDRAVAVCLDYLRHLGVEWSPHPTVEEVRREYERTWSQIGSRSIEELIELPLMHDPASLATLDVLTKLVPPALFTDANLASLAILTAVNLSLKHGNSHGSCFGYVWLGIIAGPRFGAYKEGFRFGRLGYELVEQRGLKRFEAATYMCFGHGVMPWTKHVRACCDMMRRTFVAANKIGDLTFAAYSCNALNTDLLAVGEELSEVQREAENGLEFAQKIRFGLVIDKITPQVALIRTLRGLTPKFGCFDDGQFDELRFERHLASDARLAIAECWYWIRKLQARFFAGDYASAIDASSRAQRLLWTSPSLFETAEYHFYGALAHAAFCDSASPDSYRQHSEALVAHHRQLELWAENCPDNFENRAVLVAAEIARIEGHPLDAIDLYEEAIRSAQASGFIHNEALANELAARFYAARGFQPIAHLYLRNARDCYLRWGAVGKAKELERLHPHLWWEPASLGVETTLGTPIEHLDLATVVKASQAVSTEIELKKLIDTLMVIALEHAGADRGMLILSRDDELWIEAEAATVRDTVKVDVRQENVAHAQVPHAVLRYVMRTQDSVLLADTEAHNPFSTDEHIQENRCRSMLCIPLIKQTKLIGMLYLENSRTSHVFTPARVTVLKLLASQAAISLENARLYADLAAENSERRKVEEALRASEASLAEGQRISHTGTWRWNARSGVCQGSAETFRIFGLDQTEQLSLTRYMESVHPEDRPAVEQALTQASGGKSAFSYETRIVLPDRSIRHVQSTGHPTVDQSGDLEFVGTVMDITEHRLSEAALRHTQVELARVARLTMMGELAGSIIHEINSPLAAVVGNAEVCLRWLNRDRPDLTEARDAVARLAKEGRRAAQVVKGLRTLARKSGLELTDVDMNDAIREVVELLRSELERGAVVRYIDLSQLDRPVLGDRVQLQQVLLNLIRNGIEAMSTVTDRPRILRISSRPADDGEALVTVEDAGNGLDAEITDRIFDPLFTTKPNGMGIGLSICRSIVEAHRGRLWASPNLPHGTTFRFTVPLATVEK